METRRRSIVKSMSWRIVAALVTAGVAWVVTGEVTLAASIGVADTALKVGLFYFHERTWNRLKFGRARQPEYHI